MRGGSCTGGHQLAQLFLTPLPLLRKFPPRHRSAGKPREFLICDNRAGLEFLASQGWLHSCSLVSIPHFVTLLVRDGPVQPLFHCSNKCRVRELNGDLQTIASCSIGPGWTEREALLKAGPRWTDARKMYGGFHGLAVQQCGCVM